MSLPRKTKQTAYQKKLLDPRWQKKRLQILDAAKWTCEWCRNKRETFHVHHGYYRKGADPWDYSDEYFHVLCHSCHEIAETERGEIYRVMGMIPPAKMFGLIERVVSFAAECLPEQVAVMESLPSDPEPEHSEPASEEEMNEFFQHLKTFLEP